MFKLYKSHGSLPCQVSYRLYLNSEKKYQNILNATCISEKTNTLVLTRLKNIAIGLQIWVRRLKRGKIEKKNHKRKHINYAITRQTLSLLCKKFEGEKNVEQQKTAIVPLHNLRYGYSFDVDIYYELLHITIDQCFLTWRIGGFSTRPSRNLNAIFIDNFSGWFFKHGLHNIELFFYIGCSSF